MWRKISRREYHSICRIEGIVAKTNVLNKLIWVFVALAVILPITILNQLNAQENAGGRRIPDHTCAIVYLAEFLGVAAVYAYYCHCVYLKERRFLGGPLYVQDAVCIGKKEVFLRWKTRVTINLVTNDGKKMMDVGVPDPVYKEIECDTKLILVTDWIEENGKDLDWKELIYANYDREFKVYPAKPDS